MKVLAINSGSSSVKFQLIETSPELAATNGDRLLAKGLVDKIRSAQASISYHPAGRPAHKFARAVPDHAHAIQIAFDCLTGPEGVIGANSEIDAVGHRIVHGGEHFTKSTVIDEEVVRNIENCIELAPLHNPLNLQGYRAARTLLPHAPHVAVFDTAFHQTLPPKAYLYGIPLSLYEKSRIRRYGFHGISHRYVSWRYSQIQGVPLEDLKLITCHLGNGCSICAIDGGGSVETSMGFTPLEGLVMGTRGGDLDCGILLHLLKSGEVSLSGLEDFLNRQCGLLGLSGSSSDMRDITTRARDGDGRAMAAVQVYCHRVKKYIGAYFAVLNGADAVIFTGGIGEHRDGIRSLICDSMSAIGIELDLSRNAAAIGVECDISASGSRTGVWVIPTNEELIIARDTMRCVS